MLNLTKQERFRERYKSIKPGYRPALDIYTDIMAALITPETVLLDAGCGPGGLVQAYEGVARLVVGADSYASHFDEPAEIQTLIEADIDRLPFADNRYDLVTCSWVLEHLSDPEATFAEVWRVLKPGGHFIFITPNALNYVVWLRRSIPNTISKPIVSAIYGRNEDFINPTFYRANTFRQIDRQMTGAGLTQVRFEAISDPTYLALNPLFFRLSVLIESLLDRFWPQSRVHLVGVYQKPQQSQHPE